jgi:hypothetical protein
MRELSFRAETILGVIRENTERDDSGGLTRYLAVNGSTEDQVFHHVYGVEVWAFVIRISDPGTRSVLRSLVGRGLVKKMGSIGYSCTEDGAVEYERIADRRREERGE